MNEDINNKTKQIGENLSYKDKYEFLRIVIFVLSFVLAYNYGWGWLFLLALLLKNDNDIHD